ncbi:MAG: sulfite exporter TauE/SafE family protein [Fibrobacterota bacterium]|nr:sulfite exporter TauE/SafE family protein [Fibrobacterota bacterium]QQS04845.1 MAG: sulfite exporter TauE/SafE family protein [Fibrobacterota bacterium]
MCPNFIYTWQSSLLFVLVGTVLGSLGAGGALLALPIFLMVLKVPMELAVPATTAVVGFAALSGAWDAWKTKRLDLSVLGRFAVPGMVLSALGSWVSHKIPGAILHWSFLAVVLFAGARLLLPRRASTETENTPKPDPTGLAVAGAGTGALMGLFGVGGGFLAMPALILRGGLSASAAVGVSLGAMALNAASSLAVQIPSGNLRWTLVAPALIAVLLGMEIGGWVSKRMPERVQERVLGILLLGVAVSLVVAQIR